MNSLQLALAPFGAWLKFIAMKPAGGLRCSARPPTVSSEAEGGLRSSYAVVSRTSGKPPRRILGRPRDWSDSELVARLRLGDPDAAGEMVRRFDFLVRYLCSGRSAGILDSEDLEQEAWARLTADGWDAVCAWEGRCPLAAYVSVVTTRALRLIVARAREQAEMTEPLEAAAGVAVHMDLPSEDVAAVRLSVRKLPEHQRLAISLRFFDALSHSDIAGLLGISVGTSRKRVFDGLRGLERILSESYPHLLARYGVSGCSATTL
ncbi:MAG: hypothetical protein AMXMBFR61_25910 [Fimbriimonadales bacterium]